MIDFINYLIVFTFSTYLFKDLQHCKIPQLITVIEEYKQNLEPTILPNTMITYSKKIALLKRTLTELSKLNHSTNFSSFYELQSIFEEEALIQTNFEDEKSMTNNLCEMNTNSNINNGNVDKSILEEIKNESEDEDMLLNE
jgi:hypothetical protein